MLTPAYVVMRWQAAVLNFELTEGELIGREREAIDFWCGCMDSVYKILLEK
jgi:hypothetical protein